MSHPTEILTDAEISGIEHEATLCGNDPARQQILMDAARIAKAQKSSLPNTNRGMKLAEDLIGIAKRHGSDALLQGLREYNAKIEKAQKMTADRLDPLVREKLLKGGAANGEGHNDKFISLHDDFVAGRITWEDYSKRYAKLSIPEKVDFQRARARRGQEKFKQHISRHLDRTT